MDYRGKLGEAQKLFDQAKAILENPEADSEEKAKVQPMMEGARELKAEAIQLKEILDEGSMLAAETKTVQTKVDGPADPGEFKDWADFLQAVHNVSRGHFDPRLHEFKDDPVPGQKKDMAEGTGASGGFLVPTQFLAELYAAQAENAIVRSRASKIRMTRRQVSIPVLDQTGTTAGIPHWFGGMQFYWTEEGSEKTSTDPTFRQLALVAHKMIGYTRASDELVDDSAISLADFLSGPVGFAGGVTWMEDFAFIQGSGVGQPLGVINAGATVTVQRASIAKPVQYSDLVDMYETFLPTGKGVWLLSQSVISNLLTVQDAAGNYLWLPNMQNIAGGVPPTLFGFPVVFTEKCPRVGTAGDVILADWKYYVIGDRQATTVESTKFDRWRYDQTSWRVVHRVDGRPWLSAPLTYQDGTTQTSPFVILGDKST